MSTPRRPARAFLVLALVCSLAAACGGSSDDPPPVEEGGSPTGATVPAATESEPVRGGTLVYGLAAETNGWDPTFSQWGPWGLTVARTFFDTLTVFDDQGQIHPYLAESFTPNEDFSSWTVILRPGVTFHNGEELTAEVLKANWDFYKASPLVGRIFEDIKSTTVVGPLEMRADLVRPWVNFPEAFTTQIGVVMAPESLDADNSTRAQNPIGTGPFMLEEWTPDRSLLVVANPDYWQEGYPLLDAIEFRPIPDPTSRTQALRSGDVDLAGQEEISQLDGFRDDGGFVIWQDPGAETAESFVMLNGLQSPLDDPRVRRALVLATDKVAINEVLSEGRRELAEGPYRPSSPWYVETDYPDYDLAAAQALVDEVEAETGPISFTLEVGAGGATAAETAQLIQAQWLAAGIEVDLGSSEVASLIANVVTGNYTAVLWRQFDSPTPLQETVWWHDNGAPGIGEIGLNFARNRDTELSAALDASRAATTDEDEKAQFDIVLQRMAEDLPYVFLTHLEPGVVARNGVANVLHAPIPDSEERMMSFHNSSHTLHQVWLTDEG